MSERYDTASNVVRFPGADAVPASRAATRLPVRTRIVLARNPQAGGGTADHDDVESLFRDAGCHVEVVVIDDSGSHEEQISALAGRVDAIDAIVVAGGDGTISRLLPLLLQHRVPVGILPMGTANDLARTLGIPTDLEAAARVVLEGDSRSIDIGRANDLHFCNAIGIGASVDVSREMSSNEKARFGVMAYARAVWRVLGRSSGFRVTVTGEGLQHAGRAVQVTIANGVHYGGGMTVHETAAIDDGQLDALIVRPRSVMEYLRHFFAFKFGRFSGHAPVSIGRSPHITVTTTRPRACALDGEVRTQTPLEVSVLAAALEILVPAASERGTT